MGNVIKSVTARLKSLLKFAGQRKMQAVAMMGLEYGSADIAEATGIGIDTVHDLRQGHRLTINAIRKAPDDARLYLVQVQRDMSILKGFALSHSPTLTPRDLTNVARSAAILAKSIERTAPAQAKPAAKAPPARPA